MWPRWVYTSGAELLCDVSKLKLKKTLVQQEIGIARNSAYFYLLHKSHYIGYFPHLSTLRRTWGNLEENVRQPWGEREATLRRTRNTSQPCWFCKSLYWQHGQAFRSHQLGSSWPKAVLTNINFRVNSVLDYLCLLVPVWKKGSFSYVNLLWTLKTVKITGFTAGISICLSPILPFLHVFALPV